MVDTQKKYEWLEKDIKGKVYYNEPLRFHTSLRIGGSASVFVEVGDSLSLRTVVLRAREMAIPLVVLGGGTNVLFKDEGFDGIIVSTKRLNRIHMTSNNGETNTFIMEAGAQLQKLVSISKNSGLSGAEGLAGIPGSLGGAVAGNAGAFGYEIKDIIDSILVMNGAGNFETLAMDKIRFEYRKTGLGNGWMIIGVCIKLRKGKSEDISKQINDFLYEKKKNQPLGELSAGCVFKNPKGAYAGKLLEMSGCKGMREGDMEVSRKHANFFINLGEGKADDYVRLMDKVRMMVRKSCGIDLEPEIRVY